MTTYPTAQFVEPASRNGLGIAGFVCSIVGLLITGGLLCPLGLILSLVAIGRRPRGFAIAGVVIGLLGTCAGVLFWILVGAALVLAMVAVGILAALADPIKAEVTYDMVVIADGLETYRRENRYLPADLAILALAPETLNDPWGNPYTYTLIEDEPGYDLVSDGADGDPGTLDDVRFTKLGDLWSADGNVQVIATEDGEGGRFQLKIGDQVLDISGDEEGGRIEITTEGRKISIGEDGMKFDQGEEGSGERGEESGGDDAGDSGAGGDSGSTGDGESGRNGE